MKIAKTINIANPKIFVSELKISTFNPVDSEANLANIKALNDSFVEVGNPEVALRGITAPIQNKVTGEYDDGFYPAPENMVFEVIESHSADGSESEKLAFVSFEPTKEESFYCADWNRVGTTCDEQCPSCAKADDFFNESPNGDGIDVAAGLVEMLWNKHVIPLQEQLKHEIHVANYQAEINKELSIENTKLREALEEVGKWISVKDKLPDIGEEVIVYSPKSNDGKGIVTALSRYIRYEGATEFHWDNNYPGKGNMYIQEAITHWMPLPLHPTKQ